MKENNDDEDDIENVFEELVEGVVCIVVVLCFALFLRT